jgi:hypothetical protein
MAERYDMDRERYDRERDWDRERREGRDFDRERREDWGRGGNFGRESERWGRAGNFGRETEREGWGREGNWGREPRYWDRERGWIEPRYERGEFGREGWYEGRYGRERGGEYRGAEYEPREGWITPRERGRGEYGREGYGQERYERPEYREGGRREWGREAGQREREGQWGGYGGYAGGGSYLGGLGTYGERGRFVGRGPKTYQRSDDRIREDVNERLTQHPDIDATDIDVQVKNSEVTLTGSVENREMKRMAEDVAENVSGSKEVHNQLRVQPRAVTEQTGGSQGILGKK